VAIFQTPETNRRGSEMGFKLKVKCYYFEKMRNCS
jgi:hypothetical protein